MGWWLEDPEQSLPDALSMTAIFKLATFSFL